MENLKYFFKGLLKIFLRVFLFVPVFIPLLILDFILYVGGKSYREKEFVAKVGDFISNI